MSTVQLCECGCGKPAPISKAQSLACALFGCQNVMNAPRLRGSPRKYCCEAHRVIAFNKTDKGRACIKRQNTSPKGRARHAQYRKSPKGRATSAAEAKRNGGMRLKRYNKSPKGKLNSKSRSRTYGQTPKGHAQNRRNSNKISERKSNPQLSEKRLNTLLNCLEIRYQFNKLQRRTQ